MGGRNTVTETRHYHLLRDFGVRKSTLVRNFMDNDRGSDCDPVMRLLVERRQTYTLAEIEKLFGFLMTAHHECVLEHPEDYTPLEVYTAKQVEARYDAAMAKLTELKTQGFDTLVREVSGFTSFQDLLDAKGGYEPTMHVTEDPRLSALADAYDTAQAERGDDRRAYRK